MLSKQAEWFRVLIDYANDAIFYLDLNGIIQWASRQAVAMTGRPMRDLVGSSVASVLTPQATAVKEARLASVRRGEAVPPIIELDFVGSGGRSVRVEANITSVHEKGTIIGRLLIARDITERKRAEEALQKSEHHLRTIIDTTPECVKLIAHDGTLLSMNTAGLKMIETDKAEAVIGRNIYGLVAPEHREAFQKFNDRICNGEKGTLEFEIIGLCGTRRWMETHAVPLPDGENGRYKHLAITRDITARKQAEEDLSQSKVRFELAVEAINDGLWDWRIDRNEAYLSPRWKSMLGYKEYEVPGSYAEWEKRLHPEDRDRVLAALNAYLNGDSPSYRTEYRLMHKDGAYRWILSHGIALRDKDGTPYRMVGSNSDITERKRAEEVREDLYERLQESHAGLRTLSRRLMEVQEKERRHLASELHDEIGQALTAAKINLQHLMDRPASPEVGAHLENSVNILDRTLQQVRNLSLDLRPSLLDDLGLAPTLKWMVDRHAQASGITITFSSYSDMENVRCPVDVELACYRTAQEALTNAIRHAKATMIVIALHCSDSELRLTIRDDGVGFDLNGTLTRAREGKSAGLLGILERVSLLGGQVDIQSRHGHGTQIHARFPLIPPSLPEAAHP